MIFAFLFSLSVAHANLTQPIEAPVYGTPKTLVQAVHNGMDSSMRMYGFVDEVEVERHVVDFLSQKFSIMMMKNQDSEEVLLRAYNLIRNNEQRCKLLGVVDPKVER